MALANLMRLSLELTTGVDQVRTAADPVLGFGG
jgi:hypothetical protein